MDRKDLEVYEGSEQEHISKTDNAANVEKSLGLDLLQRAIFHVRVTKCYLNEVLDLIEDDLTDDEMQFVEISINEMKITHGFLSRVYKRLKEGE